MKIVEITDTKFLKEHLLANDIFLLDTDTIIGISCSIYSQSATKKISEIKQRSSSKSYINLISSIEMLEKFCNLTNFQKSILLKNWPNSISFILKNKITNNKMLFRIPNNKYLINFINVFGPVITTSANLKNQKYALDINCVDKKILKKINYYIKLPDNINNSNKTNYPSTVVDISDNKINIIRESKYKLVE